MGLQEQKRLGVTVPSSLCSQVLNVPSLGLQLASKRR
jgi:hypothetical protein